MIKKFIKYFVSNRQLPEDEEFRYKGYTIEEYKQQLQELENKAITSPVDMKELDREKRNIKILIKSMEYLSNQ